MDDILLTLKAKGYKITSQRRAVVNALLQYEHFATAQQLLEDVKESNPDISLDTIYRILGLLIKLVNVHTDHMKNSEGAVFSLFKDGHHHHLICLECGQTQCVEICPINKEVIGVLEDNQFEMSGHTFEIYGHCKSCRQKI